VAASRHVSAGYCEQLPATSRTDCTRTLGPAIELALPAPDVVPVPEAVPLVEPVVPLVEPVLDDGSAVVGDEDDPLVPIEDELALSSVPVTWTFLPTCFESFSLSLEISL
jgi:hypothetical protein